MCVPDLRLICEIMLVSEAFMEVWIGRLDQDNLDDQAKSLSRKFITLYTLCKELLSKQVSS